MFIVGSLFLLFAIVTGWAAHRLKRPHGEIATVDSDKHSGFLKHEAIPGVSSELPARTLSMISLASAIGGFLLILASCLTSVSAGQVGVPVIYGSVQPYFIPEGLHPINPFATVKEMSVRSQTYTMVSAEGEGQVKGMTRSLPSPLTAWF